jgi:putative membrane protein
MFRVLIHWLLSAIALMVTSSLVPGFQVQDLTSAAIAAVVIGLLNATIGFMVKILTFPFAIITFGLFLLVVNASMILMASKIVPGFYVFGFKPAFLGAAVLAVLGMLIRAVMKDQ